MQNSGLWRTGSWAVSPGRGGFSLLAALLMTTAVSAEVITFNSGHIVEGKVLKQETNSILVDVGIETPVTYFRDEIKEILLDTPNAKSSGIDPHTQADALEAKAVALIDDGQMDQGLLLIQQAIALDNTPSRHMNYGSILFGNGVALFKKGEQEEAKKILQQSQDELNKAIAGFNKDKDAAFIAQAYFLLGEMSANAFADAPQSTKYYQQAVAINAHQAAQAALKKFPER